MVEPLFVELKSTIGLQNYINIKRNGIKADLLFKWKCLRCHEEKHVLRTHLTYDELEFNSTVYKDF